MRVLPYYRQIPEAENLIGVAQWQINPAPCIRKFCANLKQNTQILSVLIAHASAVPIARRAKYGGAKRK